MAVVCIDTHILIWGIQRFARSGQEEQKDRAHALLVQLEKEKAIIVVPSIVIGEFLFGLPIEQHPRFQDMISRRFVVVPYDLPAAMQFARIMREKKTADEIEVLMGAGATRAALKADAMIIATALSVKASGIYGHDRHMRRLCESFIPFHDIDTLSLQTALPEP